MARIRSIHPDACKSEKLAGVSAEAERCYWRLQTHCDDEGRCEDHFRLIWAALFPLHEDVTPVDVDRWLSELDAKGLITRYVADGNRYLAVVQWDRFQHPQKPKASTLPDPYDTSTLWVNPGEGVGGGVGVGVGVGGGGTPSGRTYEPFEQEFNQLWASYPRKEARKTALDAYQARRREGIPLEVLTQATGNFARMMADRERDKVLHGATFFGPNERWKDYLDSGEAVQPGNAALPSGASAVRRAVAAIEGR
jgi:hypothetical protein